MKTDQFIQSNIVITFLTLLSVGINFISQILLAYYFGASSERDAYFAAITLPTYLVTLFTGSITTIFLPFYVSLKKEKSTVAIKQFISSSIGFFFIVLLLLAIIGFFFSQDILNYTLPGFNAQQLKSTTPLFRVLIFIIIFQSITSFLTIFYHTENRFLTPAASPIIVSLTSLTFVVFLHQYGIMSLAMGTLTGSILSTLALSPILKEKVMLAHLFSLRNIELKLALKMAVPLIVSGALRKVTPVAERIMASELPSGSISFLGYGNQLYMLLTMIASSSIGTTFYPPMSLAWAEGDENKFWHLFTNGIRLILLITLPIAAILYAISSPVVQIIFERGAFKHDTTLAVADTLKLLLGAFLFSSLGNIVMKIFYVSKKTSILTLVSTVELLTYILSGYYLSRHFSYLGLAAALSVSTSIPLIMALIFSPKKKPFSFKTFYADVVKLLLAAAICSSITFIIYRPLYAALNNVFTSTAISSLGALILYAVSILYIFKIEDSGLIINTAKKYIQTPFKKENSK